MQIINSMKIVVKANGGLGNRMRVLASCVAISQRLRVPIEVLWINNEELNCPYHKLFLPLENISIVEKKYIPMWNRISLKFRKMIFERKYKKFDIQFSDEEIREL